MNDTEKIDELMEELDNIEKENEDSVPVITKEYNIGDEEPTTEQEKTKIMEEIQENIEQAPPEEENKEEPPKITPLPDKEKNKKKLMIILIVATVALIIAIILLSIFVHPKKDKGKTVTKNDVISYEEYKKVITDYGDAVTAAYKELRQKNKNVTNVQIEDLDIQYKEHKVNCKDVHFNNDKTVYLNDCQIKGYDNQFKFHYGEKETEDNKYKLYIYKYKDSEYYTSTTNKDNIDNVKEKNGEDAITLIKTIICKTPDCKFYVPYDDDKHLNYLFTDDNKTYLCNFKNENKVQLKNLYKDDIGIRRFVYNDKNEIKTIVIEKHDKDNQKSYLGLFHISKDKVVIEPEYDVYEPTTDNMKKRGYIAFKKKIEDDRSKLYIFNATTGEKVKEQEMAGEIRSVSDVSEGKKKYEICVQYGCFHLDENFNVVKVEQEQENNTETSNTENTENTESTNTEE